MAMNDADLLKRIEQLEKQLRDMTRELGNLAALLRQHRSAIENETRAN
jgi:hypothetical protein